VHSRSVRRSPARMTHLRHWPPAKSCTLKLAFAASSVHILPTTMSLLLTLWGEAMRRREFITLLGSAVVWPRSGVAQQSSIPIIGFLHRQVTQRDHGQCC
jgi:hypothetical protein